MSAADCLEQVAVVRPKPLLAAVPALEPESLKDARPDPLASVRSHLEGSAGILTMGCGCFLRVHPEAMKTLSTQAIVAALCDSVGNCTHRPVYH